jgi:hypothetical protein
MWLDLLWNLAGILEWLVTKRIQVERDRFVGLIRLEDKNEPVLLMISKRIAR